MIKKARKTYSCLDVFTDDDVMMKLFSSDHSSVDQIARASLEHVLVMQLDDAGATVMLSPALRALR